MKDALIITLYVLISFAYLVIGSMGLEYYLGSIWSTVIIILCLFLRLSTPVAIGVFICAVNIFHWHWVFALILALPSLGMLPLVIGCILVRVFERKLTNHDNTS